jgi:hypothetical protein
LLRLSAAFGLMRQLRRCRFRSVIVRLSGKVNR